MQYVFVCGCARSGTTTMAQLLQSHPSFAFGSERFNFLFTRDLKLTADLFQKQRFCHRLLDGDTHHETLDEYYQELASRFERCTHIGDKIPSLYRSYEHLHDAFPGFKIVFMVRNIFDVAQSFETRRERHRAHAGKPWASTTDYKDAVGDWNRSLSKTLQAIDNLDIKIVEYEKLYCEDRILEELFAFLGSKPTESVRAYWRAAAAMRQKLENARTITLDSLQKHYIMKHASFDNYQELVAGQAQGRSQGAGSVRRKEPAGPERRADARAGIRAFLSRFFLSSQKRKQDA